VQQTRIYGGQRTIGRNVDILMQILRDREYTTAFESGKRTYLYNDLDWSAAMKKGKVERLLTDPSASRSPENVRRTHRPPFLFMAAAQSRSLYR